MTTHRSSAKGGFTLMETVIAIGVLAVLITAFMAVFGPAAAGIRRAINTQEADRLASTLERELVSLRPGQDGPGINTGFDKAFEWIASSNTATDAVFVYQYRGNPNSLRSDGTATPVANRAGEPGRDFIVQPMVRRLSDNLFLEDVAALEGAIFVVRTTQLVFNNGELQAGTAGQIVDPYGGGPAASADAYPEAFIAFAAEFHSLPANNPSYFQGGAFTQRFNNLRNPVFTRNLAVRR